LKLSNEFMLTNIKRGILIYCMKRTLDYLKRWRVKYASCEKMPKENDQCYNACAFLDSFIKNNLNKPK